MNIQAMQRALIPNAPSGPNSLALVAATPSTAQATSVPTPNGVINLICDAAFGVNFGTSSSVAAPTDGAMYSAGVVHHLNVRGTYSHFKALSTDGGTLLWWFDTL